MGRRTLVAALAASCGLLAAPGAWSAPPPAAIPPRAPPPLTATLTGAAKADYDMGRKLLAEHDFAGALVRFARVSAQVHDPRLVANVALCEENLSHCGRATALFEEVLSTGGTVLSPAQRDQIRDLVRVCAPRVGRLHFTGAPDGATVEVDGVVAATSDVAVDPGIHRILIAKSGYRDLTTSIAVAAGGRAEVDAELEKAVSEGGIAVRAGPEDTVAVDGRIVGKGKWEGRVAPGIHSVVVSAEGMKSYRTDVRVREDQTRTLDVTLKEGGAPGWLWATGGALVFAGVLVAIISVFHPADPAAASPAVIPQTAIGR